MVVVVVVLLLCGGVVLLEDSMWEELGWLDLDLVWVYEVDEVQEEEEVVVGRDYGEVGRWRLMCEFDDDEVDHDDDHDEW